jgi:4-oxalocrotonate tautomerase family enzyme
MPIVRVEMWAGRSLEQKRRLAAELTEVLARVAECDPATVRVLLDDYALESWAVGGVLASERAPEAAAAAEASRGGSGSADELLVLDRLDAGRQEQLLALFQDAWWTARRSPEALERMLAGSQVVVGLVDRRSDRLVGFARAVTDRTFLAVVLDVIVDASRRGTGLGARLMDELLKRPELSAVDSIELVCQPELVAFYRRWGFTEEVGQSLLMRRTTNPLLVTESP